MIIVREALENLFFFADPSSFKQPSVRTTGRSLQNVSANRTGRFLQPNHPFSTEDGRTEVPAIVGVT